MFYPAKDTSTPFLSEDRAKHPTKVHVWVGISFRGPTSIAIFEGKMNAPLFTSILEPTFLPFIDEEYSEGHKFMQDNDPNTRPGMLRIFWRRRGSIGGEHPQSHRISIP